MERYGIPASITLAQGILESDCGNSALSRSSNNHFGIKCKSDWTGRRVFHDDDARGECFRAYGSVEASYEDHARFLDSQPRYDSLFVYPADDYRSWARGLKAARLRHRARLCAAAVPHHRGGAALPARPPAGRALYAARQPLARRAGRGRLRSRKQRESPDARKRRADRSRRFPRDDHAYKGYNIYVTNA